MARQFSVPVLDEPFSYEFTQKIYEEKEPDYKNVNGGKTFDSFIVSGMQAMSHSCYIRNMKDAEKEVKKRIEEELSDKIEYAKGYLKRLQQAQKKFKNGGIKAFEIKP